MCVCVCVYKRVCSLQEAKLLENKNTKQLPIIRQNNLILTNTVDMFSLNVIDITDNIATCVDAEPIAVTIRIMNAKAINVSPLGMSSRNLDIVRKYFHNIMLRNLKFSDLTDLD